jgi:hypothetical protein
VVIIPENGALSAPAEFLARTQQLEGDHHERPGIFVDSQDYPIDIFGSKTLQSLGLPLKPAFFVSMVPAVHNEKNFRLGFQISLAQCQITNETQMLVCKGDRCERFFEIARKINLVSDELRPLMRVLCQDRFISRIMTFDDVINVTFRCCRIEVVPVDQRAMDVERERFYQITFNSEIRDDSRWGEPHLYKLVKGETAAQLINQIRPDFRIPEKEKMMIIKGGAYWKSEVAVTAAPYDIFQNDLQVVDIRRPKSPEVKMCKIELTEWMEKDLVSQPEVLEVNKYLAYKNDKIELLHLDQ